ncbi:MAG TPA: ROK family protein [Firmicutes bacterium]|nr:ROK family protein [Bacillota bacterium]
MAVVAGIDIGGTKLAVTLARVEGETLRVVGKEKAPTPRTGGAEGLALLGRLLRDARRKAGVPEGGIAGIGISCGGPLDSRRGIILSPPNLPGWDEVPVKAYFERETGAPAVLRNDADACAVAEWRYGAGRGCRNMVFLTFGTGFGAGLILNGALYSGSCDMAGEIGHIRAPGDPAYRPVGYGKSGSFEGYCSGGGIAELGRAMALEAIQRGRPASFCPTPRELEGLTAQAIAQAAEEGDPLAREVYACSGRQLGGALALLVDLLNPEAVVIGSIYARSTALLRDAAMQALERESLPLARQACRVLPAALGEHLGDVAALSLAPLPAAGEGSGQPTKVCFDGEP